MSPHENGQPPKKPSGDPKLWTDSFDDVRLAEAPAIHTRRRVDSTGLPQNLIGLALSGGGIRAASVGLGALQSLRANRQLDKVDYLSTVSGGGYIGAYLSSGVLSSEATMDDVLGKVPPDRDSGPNNGQQRSDTCNDADPSHSGEPPWVRRFIFGGKYLVRPWEAANKYFIGLFFNCLLTISGLVAAGALVALAWRALDLDPVRNFFELFNVNSSLFAAFLPFYVCLACWIVAWGLSYFKYSAEAPGSWAQRWLYVSVASFLIGVTLVLVNPETTLGYLELFFDKSKLNETSITKWLIGLVAAGLTPFLAPRALMQIGLNPKTLGQKIVFHLAMGALLVGVPLVVVGLLAMPDISNTATDPDHNLRAGDIVSWPAFTGVCLQLEERLRENPKLLLEKLDDEVAHNLRAYTTVDLDRLRVLAMKDFRVDPPDDGTESATTLQSLIEGVDRFHELDRNLKEHPSHLYRLLLFLAMTTDKDNLMARYWDQQSELDRQKEEFCHFFSQNLLNSRVLPFLLIDSPDSVNTESNAAPRAQAATSSGTETKKAAALGFNRIREALKKKDVEKLQDTELDEAITDAALSYRSEVWRERDAREFNLALLRALHPECFYDNDKAYYWLVIVADEWKRFWIFLGAGATFLVAAAFVNLNTTSLHRFYRNRLRHAYFVPHKQGGRLDFNLSDLNTTDHGYPYHLVNATVDLSQIKFLDEVDKESGTPTADRRDVQTFTFSRDYCGSDATGWRLTEDYETFRDDNINFSDAIALSGSPIDAQRTNSIAMSAAMTTLNLAIGQWMPNPKFPKPPAWKIPSFLTLLWDWRSKPPEESAYCYISDGGFYDNLGILALLRRRCRLIVALDASCDPQAAFVDLTAVFRSARIRFGVKLFEPTADGLVPQETLNTSCFEPNKKGWCRRHFALARVAYEGSSEHAWLVYIKPSFTGDEGADLLKYRVEEPDFPNNSTTDQFYEPPRVESYRQLGAHMVEELCNELRETGESDIFKALEKLEAMLVDEAKTRADRRKIKRDLPLRAVDALNVGYDVSATLNRMRAAVDALPVSLSEPMDSRSERLAATIDKAVQSLQAKVAKLLQTIAAMQDNRGQALRGGIQLIATELNQINVQLKEVAHSTKNASKSKSPFSANGRSSERDLAGIRDALQSLGTYTELGLMGRVTYPVKKSGPYVLGEHIQGTLDGVLNELRRILKLLPEPERENLDGLIKDLTDDKRSLQELLERYSDAVVKAPKNGK